MDILPERHVNTVLASRDYDIRMASTMRVIIGLLLRFTTMRIVVNRNGGANNYTVVTQKK
jgi:hypothetical protein